MMREFLPLTSLLSTRSRLIDANRLRHEDGACTPALAAGHGPAPVPRPAPVAPSNSFAPAAAAPPASVPPAFAAAAAVVAELPRASCEDHSVQSIRIRRYTTGSTVFIYRVTCMNRREERREEYTPAFRQ